MSRSNACLRPRRTDSYGATRWRGAAATVPAVLPLAGGCAVGPTAMRRVFGTLKRPLWLRWLTGVVALAAAGAAAVEPAADAETLFKRYEQALYQVRVIDLASGEKSGIGSGFCFSAAGDVATNFHVIAAAVHEPERFRVEAVRRDGSASVLQVRHIDVVHDLAIVRGEQPGAVIIPLGTSDVAQGVRLFSLGNPYDLGTVIVEGTNNGLIEKSLYRKILFSGSINPGMSGGPTIDSQGRVVGINVATAGNQVSFLVPVERLIALAAQQEFAAAERAAGWEPVIEAQLLEREQFLFEALFAADWGKRTIGAVSVPADLIDIFKCWGGSDDKKIFQTATLTCFIDDDVFISRQFQTGRIVMEYSWLESGRLNPLQFYHQFAKHADIGNFNNAEKEDVTNFKTESGFVRAGGKPWKVAFSARQYKKYPALYDVSLAFISTGEWQTGLFATMQLWGVRQDSALRFAQRVMEELAWP